MGKLATIISLVLLSKLAWAEDVYIAVASNFANAAKVLTAEFARTSPNNQIILVFGSTGKLYAQIRNGAPYSAFLSADENRPKLLAQTDKQPFTYAVGRLALWSPKPNLDVENILNNQDIKFIAIANQKLAPYGRAAQEVLSNLGMWDTLHPKLVFGENIIHAWQFAKSGNAELGFVAFSQVKNTKGSYWLPDGYRPIYQDAILLNNQPVAIKFLEFLKSPQAKDIIKGLGYDLPPP
jgi:molybdate transport system substrate-binding protein